MQFSAVLNMFIVKTYLNSIFTNDLKRKENFSKNVQSYRVCSFYIVSNLTARGHNLKPDKPRFRTTFRCLQRIVNDWNALPPYIVNAKNVSDLKSKLDQHWNH